jgi:hypothetical protein
MVTIEVALLLLGVGLVCASIVLGVYIAYRKPKLDKALPDGVYRIHFKGYAKLTGAPEYDIEEVEDGEVSDTKQA